MVDDFSSYLTADTYNRDFASNINLRTKQLTPITVVKNFQLQNPIVLNSLGTVSNTNIMAISSISGTQTNLFTLPYSKVDTIIQPLATGTVSLNPFSLAITQGIVKLSPPMDNWIDTRSAPTIMVTDDRLQLRQEQQGLNLTNTGDFNGLVDRTTDDYVHILPFIRPQQLIFRAKGLLVNTPVSAWFDGKNVDYSIESASTIELKNVTGTGTFKEDDIIGFYVSAGSKFYPTGRVVSVYNYPNGKDVRLYIAAVVGQPQYTSTQVIQNAKFDSTGVYIPSSATASGTINNGVSSLKLSGNLTGVGGGYTPVGGSGTYQIYKTNNPHDWGSFMNQYSVWGNLAHYTSTAYTGVFNVNIPVDGTYTILASSSSTTSNIYIDSVSLGTIAGPTVVSTFTKYLTAGIHVISWNIPGNASIPLNGIAMIAKDENDNIVFESTNPPNLNYDSVDQELLQVGGGAWFTGVTKIKLDAQASNVNNFYAGAKITVASKFFVEQKVETASYYPPPPPPPSDGGGCGGDLLGNGCFTGDTKVTMSDGTKKKISEIEIGDEVMNFDGTSINKVLFVEKTIDTHFHSLYSPVKKYKPFATINHPLYIDGKLSCVEPDFNYSVYPWLGKNEKLIPTEVMQASGQEVYNLWTDGDSTYIVNGYGTTTIIGDGGVIRLAYEQGLIPAERASGLLTKFTSASTNTVYGAYLFNKSFGKLNLKPVNYILAIIYADDNKNKIAQKVVDTIFSIVGGIAMIFKNK